MSNRIGLPLLLVAVMGVNVWAQEAEKPADAPAAAGTPAAAAPAAAADRSSAGFSELIKDMKLTEGLINFYRPARADLAKDPAKLIAVIPKSLLKQDLLLTTNISRGSYAGWQWGDSLVRWEVLGKNLVLVAPETRFQNRADQAITGAVERTYLPTYITTLPILMNTPTGDYVVDFGALVLGDAGVARLPRDLTGSIRRDLSKIHDVKAFPDNVLVDADLAVGGRGEIQQAGMSLGMRRLPDTKGYKPRKADERIGFFLTARQDWSTKYSDKEMLNRYINRWDLKKKDASLELSPPEKPITFVIDKAVPLQYRKYVADGVRSWNKAFEKIGIAEAIVVQQQTDDNEFASADPADARYNFIQWTVRGEGLAVGPSRADPRTGQILDADIVVDDAWLRVLTNETELFTPKTLATMVGPSTLKFWAENPTFAPPGFTPESLKQAEKELNGNLMQEGGATSMTPDSYQQCSAALGMAQQLSLADMLAAAGAQAGDSAKLPESLVGEAIRNVVAHEVGHTLGLRHNFKASAWLSTDEIKKRRDAGQPFIASVMDYTPLAYFPGDDVTKVKSFSSATPGPYDMWAIEYGYGSGDNETAFLAKVASRCNEPENAYATDEDTTGLVSIDPLVNRYDMSSDPVAWATSRIALSDGLLADFKKWAVKDGEPNYYARNTFAQLIFERSRNAQYIARMVGGQEFNRNRPGDPNYKPALVPIEPKKQREALAALGKTVFSADFYKMDPAILNELVPARWYDWSSDPAERVDFPYITVVQRMYGPALSTVCSPQILQRVYDAEPRSTGDDRFTAVEMVTGVRDQIWGELDRKANHPFDNAHPMIAGIRRNLQNDYLTQMLGIVDNAAGLSGDGQNMVRFAMRELSQKIDATLKAGDKIDFATRAHLTEAKSRIDRTLEKPLTSQGGSGGIPIRIR